MASIDRNPLLLSKRMLKDRLIGRTLDSESGNHGPSPCPSAKNMKTSTLHKKAEQALKAAVYNLVKDKARENKKLVVWQNGKVIEISARTCMKKYEKKEKSMRRKFKCDCSTHIIEVEYDENKAGKKAFPTLGIEIYDIYNPDTGRKYQKPKPTSDVVLMNNAFPKELEKFLKFMEKIIKKYRLSQK